MSSSRLITTSFDTAHAALRLAVERGLECNLRIEQGQLFITFAKCPVVSLRRWLVELGCENWDATHYVDGLGETETLVAALRVADRALNRTCRYLLRTGPVPEPEELAQATNTVRRAINGAVIGPAPSVLPVRSVKKGRAA